MNNILQLFNNLKSEFPNKLPSAVSIAPDGLEKSFAYLQLSKYEYWKNFFPNSPNNVCIYPLLQSSCLGKDDIDVIEKVRSKHKKFRFSHTECRDRINAELEEGKLDWTKFWIEEICKAVKFKKPKTWANDLRVVDDFLREKERRVIFLFDGIEEIFPEFSTNISHEIAINSLLDIPKHIAYGISDLHIGIIIFICKNTVPHVIVQNSGQFIFQYDKFII
jgi:hypothetical protein